MLRHRRSLDLQSEMNLTNLLDTAFVLLIAFMLMAPMLKHGIELRLPTIANAGSIATQQSTITIVINKALEGNTTNPIYIEDQRLTIEQMAEKLKDKMSTFESVSVVIEADREVPWESVAQVLATVKQIGIKSVGLIFQPKDSTKRQPAHS
ncbi:biopolymer transporter ExbD [bacterium]|nr:biopolymer transporter ExbD [bacterium]